ncbi:MULTISPECIES: hypothetical protein [Sphingobium]|uniref:hypothetical protein n=1 Tax=Sphingobium TaxID=165695 RepID=UPI00093252E8|nr:MULTISPECIES: hypothetical protein [Sphingobium]
MLTWRTVIPADQLQRAADWIVRQSHPLPAVEPLLQAWVVIVGCDTAEDAIIFALAARGRSNWCMSDDTTWYLVESDHDDTDRCAEIAFAADAVKRYGLQDRCDLVDGLLVDFAFRSEHQASAFEAAVSSGLFA